jgi:8-oxo-dGTP pyrophosphatase MutT (NUDIX family)
VTEAPAEARRASTVIVARDAADGIEIVLTQRHTRLRFMGGTFVFPGGAVDRSDSSAVLADHIAVPPVAWPNAEDETLAWSNAMAAVRETFEEAGLLIGASTADRAVLQTLRMQLLAGGDFGELLAAAQITLDLGDVVPLIRWVTPRTEPIRFDTRFYVAPAPSDQIAAHDARESIALIWLSPARAMEEAEARERLFSPPTLRTLEQIRHLTSVSALLEFARVSTAPTVEPVFREIEGVKLILYPGDPEHPVRERALLGATRHRIG